ncbi:MAG: DUF542 domain-containing protein [Erysipelotrichaceae bacterium]|nr:DUF542 domain-containing protein [Erysipelotrichaceae bacterium]MDD3809216.1 DUF542 domain-containing protein [Erysipelotrichaceae bacterium]
MITKEMKIEEVVKQNPDAIDILSECQIDFCCGGKQVLNNAAKEAGQDPDELVARIASYRRPGKADDWRQVLDFNREELINYIVVKHHRQEELLIEEVERLLAKILYVHYRSHQDSLAPIYRTFLELKGELTPHFAQEEKIDFPAALAGDPIDWSGLKDDHEQVGGLLKKLQELSSDFTPPDDACTTYRRAFEKLHELVDDIHLHVFLENSVLFEK